MKLRLLRSANLERTSLSFTEGHRTRLKKTSPSARTKFVRLAEYRINKAMDAIGRLEALSNRSSYEYTPEQVEAMFGALQSRIDAVKELFMAKKAETIGFSFGSL